MFEEITLEMARMERQATAAVRAKIAARQLGEAWVGLGSGPAVHAIDEVHLDRVPPLTPTR